MKKISIMLLAALMLFAFVACDNDGNKDEAEALTFGTYTGADVLAEATEGDTTLKVSDLAANVSVANGVVTAELNNVSENQLLPTTAKKGYFLPLLVTNNLGEEAQLTVKKGTETTAVDAKLVKTVVEGNATAKNYVVIYVAADTGVEASDIANDSYTITITNKANEKFEGTVKLTSVTFAEEA